MKASGEAQTDAVDPLPTGITPAPSRRLTPRAVRGPSIHTRGNVQFIKRHAKRLTTTISNMEQL